MFISPNNASKVAFAFCCGDAVPPLGDDVIAAAAAPGDDSEGGALPPLVPFERLAPTPAGISPAFVVSAYSCIVPKNDSGGASNAGAWLTICIF